MATGIGQFGLGLKQYRYGAAGKYFTATNATPGTGIISGVVTSLADTTPYVVFKNNNAVGTGINCHLDFLQLDVTVVGTTFSGSRKFAHKTDLSQTTTRYSSGGTGPITPQPTGRGSGSIPSSSAQVYVGAITAAAAGDGRLIQSGTLSSAIEVVFSTYVFDFGGGVQQPYSGLIDNSTTVMHKVFPTAPIVVGPQEHYLLHIWGASLSVGITFGVNMGWVEV